jgi:tripartite-type tricarboxylate transporter receptor subunit TctC
MLERASLKRGAAAMFAAAALLALCTSARAQADYPSRPIRLVVPYPPGGNTDVIAREIARGLSTRLGQPVNVENRAGANGTIGTDAVAKSAPDGYTFGVVIGAYTISQAMNAKLPYKPSELIPVSHMTRTSLVLVTGAGVPARSLPELIEVGRKASPPLSYGSSGVGSAAHLLGARFVQATRLADPVHVAYKGSSEAVSDLVGGRLGFMFDAVSAMGPQIKAGRMTAVAVTGKERSPMLPDVPSMAELGYPGLVSYAWSGLLAPAGTPRPIVDRIAAEVATVLANDELRQKLAVISTEPIGSTPAEFAAFLQEDIRVNAEVVRQFGIRAE